MFAESDYTLTSPQHCKAAKHMIQLQVAAAQQYSVTLRGYPALQQWIKKHTWAMHSPPADHDVLVTSGSNHTIEASHLTQSRLAISCGTATVYVVAWSQRVLVCQQQHSQKMHSLCPKTDETEMHVCCKMRASMFACYWATGN